MVAFVTAYDEFAVQAFELNAVDYLLKPVERERLATTLDRARERETGGDRARGLAAASAAIEAATRKPFLERIPVRKREDVMLLPVRQIASIVAEGELLHLTTHRQRALHDRASPERARGATRSPPLRPARPRRAGGGGSHQARQRDARRHLPGDAVERPGAASEPAPVARAARDAAAAVERRNTHNTKDARRTRKQLGFGDPSFPS